MFGLGASPRFRSAASWWRNPLSPARAAAADSPWDVAAQKHLEVATVALSPLSAGGREPLLVEDPELEAIKAKVREMEEEDEWLQGLQAEAENFILRSDPGRSARRTAEEKVEADQRSIYVGNVDYGGSAEELEAHFSACGQINRVTILCDKFSGHPKGYAYIEFADGASVKAAVRLDKSTFRGRAIKVLPKRTNMPGISSTDRGRSQGRFHGRGTLARRASFCGRRQRSRARGWAHRRPHMKGDGVRTDWLLDAFQVQHLAGLESAWGHGRLSLWYTSYQRPK